MPPIIFPLSRLNSGSFGDTPFLNRQPAVPIGRDVAVGISSFLTPASTGNLDITAPASELGGKTPRAALIFLTAHVPGNDPNETAEAIHSVGATDGVTQIYASTASRNGVTTTSTWRKQGTGAVINGQSPVDGTPSYSATFVNWIANGVTLNFSAVGGGTVIRGYAIFFAGNDVSAFCGVKNMGTNNQPLTVSGLPHTPQLIFSLYSCDANATALNGVFDLCFGMVVGPSQCWVGWAEQTGNVAGGSPAQVISVLNGSGQKNTGGTAVGYQVLFGNIQSGSFDVTPSTNTGSDDLNFLSLNLGGVPVSLFNIASPTSTGNQSYTDPGFKPQFLMTLGTNLESYDTSQYDVDLADGLGIGACTVTTQWAASVRITASGATTATANRVKSVAVDIPRDGAASGWTTASLVSFDATGATLNWTTVQGTAKKLVALAIGVGWVPNSYAVGLQAASSPVATLVRQAGKILQATSSPIATLTRQTGKILQATTSPIASLIRQTGKILQAVTSPIATLTKARLITLQATTSPVASLIRQTGKILQATTAPVATLVRQIAKILQATLSPIATLTKARAVTLQATTSPISTLIRQTGKILQASTSPIATLVRQTGKLLQASTAPPASLVRQLGKLLKATTSPVASLVRQSGKILQASTAPVAAVVRQISKILAAASSPAATLVRSAAKSLQAVASASASLTRGMAKLLQATSGAAATVRRSIGKNLSAASLPLASLSRRVGKLLLASAVSIASISKVATLSILARPRLMGSKIMASLSGQKSAAGLDGSKTTPSLSGSKSNKNLDGTKTSTGLDGEVDE